MSSIGALVKITDRDMFRRGVFRVYLFDEADKPFDGAFGSAGEGVSYMRDTVVRYADELDSAKVKIPFIWNNDGEKAVDFVGFGGIDFNRRPLDNPYVHTLSIADGIERGTTCGDAMRLAMNELEWLRKSESLMQFASDGPRQFPEGTQPKGFSVSSRL